MFGYIDNYVTVFVFVLVGAVFVVGVLWLSKFLRLRPTPEKSELKQEIYECGEETQGLTWIKFDLRFYIVALLFLIFDVEVALLYPWARVYKHLGALAAVEAIVFIIILSVPLFYVWLKGDLEWVKSIEADSEAD
ncbi:MAG: NADH-quinone oxidoreductase subunit A [Planctomycetes bacterium]|nr:NADH-quinone oxidoreductase subunit A [Planctomycetota bacterium]